MRFYQCLAGSELAALSSRGYHVAIPSWASDRLQRQIDKAEGDSSAMDIKVIWKILTNYHKTLLESEGEKKNGKRSQAVIEMSGIFRSIC